MGKGWPGGKTSMRKIFRSFSTVATLAFMSLAAFAQATASFNLPAQPLADSLRAVAEQTNSNILFDRSLVAGVSAKELKAELSVDAALRELLAGTGLTFKNADDKTVMIVAETAGAKPTARSDSADPGLRVAQADDPQGSQKTPSGANTSKEVLEEVVVTAQKRAERLQDVPISISVLSGEKLDSYTGGTARDILRTVPGVTFARGLGDGTTLSIRGVGPAGILTAPFGASTVGYYMDGIPFGFVSSSTVPDTNVYDLERIEVLRGPQGTLYGASSLNGVVRVLTHEAEINAFQVKARTSGATTEGGDETYRVDGAINIPIVEDKLAARATVSYVDFGGWIDNLARKDINGWENLDARVKMKAQPTDALSIGLSYWRSRRDTRSYDLSDSNDLYPGTQDPAGTNDFDTYGAQIDYEFPGLTVSSTTSFMEYSNVSQVDWSAFTELFGLTDYLNTVFDAKVFSEELLIRSSNDGDWRWSVGAFYRDAQDRFKQFNPPLGVFADPRSKSKSYAVFGELTKLFLNGALELTGGLRHFHDRVENTEGLDPNYNPSASFEKVTPRAVLTWHANKDHTLYATYSQGFRSGFNQNRGTLSAVPDLPPVKPDTLDSYEIGVKGNLSDYRFAYETAAYFLDWQDTQQSLCFTVDEIFCALAGLNAESASGLGAELALTMRPLDSLALTGSFAVNDVTVDSPISSGNYVLYEKGGRLNGSAKYTAAASASYTFPLGASGLSSTLSLSGTYMSSFPQRILDTTNGTLDFSDSDSVSIMQGSVNVAAADRWSLQLFADNLTNERPAVQFDGGFVNFFDRHLRPRTIGVQFEYRLGRQ
jgi:iron complex outermembrane recepter protein